MGKDVEDDPLCLVPPPAPFAPPLRLVFMGTAELAGISLRAAAHGDFSIQAVVSQPDKARGRDLKLQPTPVKEVALELGLPVFQPLRAREEAFVATLRELAPDLIVVVAYGQILPPAILDLPRFGAINVHTSLLPRHRGAAPIQWSILEGDSETGVTIMKMDAGLDTGDMLSVRRTPILPSDNAQTLHDRLGQMGAELLVETIPAWVTGQITPQPQPSAGATYARKITKEDGALDWRRPARQLWNQVRGLTPWPGTFTWQPAEPRPRLLKIWEAQVVAEIAPAPGKVVQADKEGIVIGCGEGALRVLSVQREGGRRLAAGEFLLGNPVPVGEVWGAPNNQ